MNIEIERKFLVKDRSFIQLATEIWSTKQGYLLEGENKILRISENWFPGSPAKYTLCFKASLSNTTRQEYEYLVSQEDGLSLLTLCPVIIEKERYRVPATNKLYWDVDVFHGDNQGLVVAEIEMPNESTAFDLPDWVSSVEVTDDPKYLNVNLAKNPYKNWR